ncbi:hypothetical protein MOQ_004159 [Trypanosoma cruzi marinkellei]|uniref:Uncharacterized protein n=1 Tax=Trypanosoma cruzi marinkellei TaxID=85056 RepID=K2N208_TRYCR|nr:hypothetical protein MOQ_004159 [Trypanosoma cruzi marinkellei]
MEQKCQSVASDTAESSSSSLVLTVADAWASIRAYFMEVQAAVEDVALAEIADRLPHVTHSLEVIRKALLKERSQMMQSGFEPQVRKLDTYSASSVSSKSDVLMSLQRPSFKDPNSNSHFGKKAGADGVWRLPPCYTFLWDEPLFTSHEEENTVDEEEISPVGHMFLLSLCQFAKHDDPPGARRIIICFLARVFSEADLPCLPYRGDPPRSLLQMFPGNTVVPLIDMLRQVAARLRPKTVGKEDTMGMSSASNTRESNTDAVEEEREALLNLLCALTERMEQVPALAMFFIPEAVTDAKEEADFETNPESSPTVGSSFSILHELLVYAKIREESVHPNKQQTIYQLALRGLLSLAKCPDPAVQDYVKKQTAVPSATLMGARTTLLTLCTVPYNNDTNAQLTYLSELLRFWSQLILLSPAVAEAWGVEAMIESSFVHDALVPLFCSAEEKVYAAAALVTARTVRFVGRSPPFYISAVTRALLGTCIDRLSGNSMRLTVSPKEKFSSLSSTGTLLEYVLLPHLAMRNDEDWSCTEVTLYLLDTIALYEPVLFMEFALSLSMSTLAEVYVGAFQRSLQSDLKNAYGKSTTATSDGDDTSVTNSSPEKTRNVDYLQHLTSDLELSAAETSPYLDVTECFSARLRAPRGIMLWSNNETIAEEILARLLLVESNVPAYILEKRQRIMNRSCRGVGEEFVESVLEGSDHSQTHQETSFASVDDQAAKKESNNIWFHTGVHQSPLVERLCEITSKMLIIPSVVCTLLTQLWSTICVLPDFRVLYTLMDSRYGQLRQALFKLRDTIDEGLQHDEDVAFAIASAAAAVAAKTNMKTELVDVGSQNKLLAESSLSIGSIHATASHLYTRTYLYFQFIQLGKSLCWVRDIVEEEFPNHELLIALKKHRSFLEACACVEAFRMELDAAIGHVALSHSLMCIKTGKEHARRNPHDI